MSILDYFIGNLRMLPKKNKKWLLIGPCAGIAIGLVNFYILQRCNQTSLSYKLDEIEDIIIEDFNDGFSLTSEDTVYSGGCFTKMSIGLGKSINILELCKTVDDDTLVYLRDKNISGPNEKKDTYSAFDIGSDVLILKDPAEYGLPGHLTRLDVESGIYFDDLQSKMKDAWKQVVNEFINVVEEKYGSR